MQPESVSPLIRNKDLSISAGLAQEPNSTLRLRMPKASMRTEPGKQRAQALPFWRIVLLEGQPLLRDLLARFLHSNPRFQLIAELDDPKQGEELCRRMIPDLLITEVRLPQGDGLRLVEELRKELSAIRILVLSQSTDSLTLHRLREIGIHGFVEKEQSLEILEEAIADVASGGTYFTAIWHRTHSHLRADPEAFTKYLSTREQEVLRLVAAGQTSKSIALHLGLSARWVETYRYRMMRKLGIDSMAGLIEFGLRLSLAPLPA